MGNVNLSHHNCPSNISIGRSGHQGRILPVPPTEREPSRLAAARTVECGGKLPKPRASRTRCGRGPSAPRWYWQDAPVDDKLNHEVVDTKSGLPTLAHCASIGLRNCYATR